MPARLASIVVKNVTLRKIALQETASVISVDVKDITKKSVVRSKKADRPQERQDHLLDLLQIHQDARFHTENQYTVSDCFR